MLVSDVAIISDILKVFFFFFYTCLSRVFYSSENYSYAVTSKLVKQHTTTINF